MVPAYPNSPGSIHSPPTERGAWADFQLAGVHLPLMFRFVPVYFSFSFSSIFLNSFMF
jgi:hypothetical protein